MSRSLEVPAPRAIDRLRETARDLFYRRGIRAVGVDEIVTQAGVTKPSLYRAFPSKDALAADFLRNYAVPLWDTLVLPGDATPAAYRSAILRFMENLGERCQTAGYRGCGLTNAVLEYPDIEHPVHAAAAERKRAFLEVLSTLSAGLGARDPHALADGLLLLIEGAYVTGQVFGRGGPGASLVSVTKAWLASNEV